MAWTAIIIGKSKASGTYIITVEYTDGVSTITETIRSLNPSIEWVAQSIKNRVVQLDAVEEFDITVGTPPDPVPDVPDVNLEKFKAYIRILPTIKTLIDLAVVPEDNPKVKAITDYLKANMAAYFDEITK